MAGRGSSAGVSPDVGADRRGQTAEVSIDVPTRAAVRRPGARQRLRDWARLGRRPAPWLHAASVGTVGAVFAAPTSGMLVAVLFGGLAGIVAPLVCTVVVGAIAGLIAGHFRTAGVGVAVGFATGIAWLPAVVGGTALGIAGRAGTLDPSSPFPLLAGGLLAAVVAMLTHRGLARTLALALLLGGIAVGAVVVVGSQY